MRDLRQMPLQIHGKLLGEAQKALKRCIRLGVHDTKEPVAHDDYGVESHTGTQQNCDARKCLFQT